MQQGGASYVQPFDEDMASFDFFIILSLGMLDDIVGEILADMPL